jgi:hypothetical protein
LQSVQQYAHLVKVARIRLPIKHRGERLQPVQRIFAAPLQDTEPRKRDRASLHPHVGSVLRRNPDGGLETLTGVGLMRIRVAACAASGRAALDSAASSTGAIDAPGN